MVQEPKQDPQWLTLCELTNSMEPVYCVTNLQPNRQYKFEVAAVNGVGVGDELVFEAHTAPCEPAPPLKPWLKKRKGDAVCVAWYKSSVDGGAPILAYKLVMKMLPGASKWNPLGPSEDEASKVDVAMIDARNHPHEHGQDIYSSWIQLDEPQCQYKFK